MKKCVGGRPNSKCGPVDSNMLYQEALSPYKYFSKESPETNDTKPFPPNKG